MSVQFDAFKTHAANEGMPFAMNTVLTAAATYGGQYLPKVVEVLSFEMATEALGVGSALTALGGSLATVAGKTFLGEDKYKSQAYSILTYTVGAFAAAYFAPAAASLVGMAITFENAMALFAASTAAFAVRSLLFNGETKKPDENKATAEEVKKMSKEEFEKLAAKLKDKTEVLTNKDAEKVATDRIEITKTHNWDSALYDTHAKAKDGNLDLEAYQKAGEKIAA